MTTNAAIANIAEQQVITTTELTEFISTLKPVVKHNFLEQHQLSGENLLVNANEDLYITLHNVDKELTGAKQVEGEQAGVVVGTENDKPGFFQFVGNSPKLILLTDNYLTTNKIHNKTGYNTVMIGCLSDLTNTIQQLAPFKGDTVIIYCSDGQTLLDSQVASLGIEAFDCSNEYNFQNRMNETVQRAKLRIPRGYILKEDGVYAVAECKDGVEIQKWICSPLKVSALTRDIQSQGWGRYIEVLDADSVTHSFAMPMEQLIGNSFMQPLAHRGLTFKSGCQSDVNEYLMKAAPVQRARSVSKTGWYQDLFVLPNKVIGETGEKVVYQNTSAAPCNYEESGTLEQWQDNVSALCKGNSRLAFGVSTAFATMMLRLVGGESGGFHFRGGSSRGKTTILTLAKSVFGNPENLPRWRSTVNGLEALAANHNHTLLCLDEFSQLAEVNPKSAGEAIYMLGNGEGKQRVKNNGLLIENVSWQLLYLSAGEVSLDSVLKSAGLQTRAGQEVRFIDLPADAGTNLGAFNTVQDYPDGNQFALAIKENSLRYYGTAATTFLEKVTVEYETVKLQMIDKMDEFLELLDLTNADPQVHRVARRFAQVAASGEIATALGITGWDEDEANNAALSCFESWVDTRGGQGSQEYKVALEQVSGKLLTWGLLRFNTAEQTAARNGEVWGIQDKDFFYLYTAAFKNTLCEGLDSKTVENVLLEVGVLIPSSSRRTVQKKINGTNVRVYKISKKVLGFTSIEAAAE